MMQFAILCTLTLLVIVPACKTADDDREIRAYGDNVEDDDSRADNDYDCGDDCDDEDRDGDGVPDSKDSCPLDANKAEPGECGCGTSESDNDSDGTVNCLDVCPSDEDKTTLGQCGCGVPDTDSDSDGVADCNDKCPSDQSKTDPGACGCGQSEESCNLGSDTDGEIIIIPEEDSETDIDTDTDMGRDDGKCPADVTIDLCLWDEKLSSNCYDICLQFATDNQCIDTQPSNICDEHAPKCLDQTNTTQANKNWLRAYCCRTCLEEAIKTF